MLRSIVQNESQVEMSSAHLGSPPLATPRRRAMVEDLPPEILGLDTVVKLRALGLLSLKEVAEQVSGPQLMYDLGLSRDEIHDLYYNVRDNYGLKMNIGQEFRITLHIFRPEFRRKYPLPKYYA